MHVEGTRTVVDGLNGFGKPLDKPKEVGVDEDSPATAVVLLLTTLYSSTNVHAVPGTVVNFTYRAFRGLESVR